MNIHISGNGTLAATTRTCCARHFILQAFPANASIIWFCHDTPILEHGQSDTQFLLHELAKVIPQIPESTPILISSQIPSGFMRKVAGLHPDHIFGYSPENIRVKNADYDFTHQARIVLGTPPNLPADSLRLFDELLGKFSDNLIHVSIETAEMVKHALNGFLALSVAYANELALLCHRTGANVDDVTEAMKSDPRIGPMAYLRAGEPYGQHLEREINNLSEIDPVRYLPSAIRLANEDRKLQLALDRKAGAINRD